MYSQDTYQKQHSTAKSKKGDNLVKNDFTVTCPCCSGCPFDCVHTFQNITVFA